MPAPTRIRNAKGAAHDLATTSIYLFIGFEIARRINPTKTYDDMLGAHDGQLNLMKHIVGYAAWADEVALQLDATFPGVFHYEVTEYLGIWLFSNINATRAEFMSQLRQLVKDKLDAAKASARSDTLDAMRYAYSYGSPSFMQAAQNIIKLSTL